ncbi:hypothetical protein D3C71_2217350 [compost metagenome]
MDTLLDLLALHAQRHQLVLHPLIIQHGQQLLAIDLLLLRVQNLGGIDHGSLG